jgi:hypothetical protein
MRLILFIISLSALPAFGGGWVSGGGELIKDANNPWFLANTNEVTYCIEVDPANFSLSSLLLPQMISDEINFWKKDFKNSKVEMADPSPWTPVANQAFIEQPCQESTDIRFQFGTLSGAQRTELRNFQRYVAITIRTDYDLRRMRGKGFIYFSADRGVDLPNFPGIYPDFWSRNADGCALREVIRHELGHVFGLPHRGDMFSLMGEGFPQQVATSGSCRSKQLTYLSWDKPSFDVSIAAEIKKLMGIPSDMRIKLKSSRTATTNGFTVLISPYIVSDWKRIGYLEYKIGRGGSTPNRIWFPYEQEVFPSKLSGTFDSVQGRFTELETYADFHSDAGGTPIGFRLAIDGNQISGEVIGGRIWDISGWAVQ